VDGGVGDGSLAALSAINKPEGCTVGVVDSGPRHFNQFHQNFTIR
jgi:hypothetical protein